MRTYVYSKDVADGQLVETTGGLTRDYYPDECYHVSWLGVVPGHQGKGYGGAMTRYALQRGKDDGENVRLHTHNQENVSPLHVHG